MGSEARATSTGEATETRAILTIDFRCSTGIDVEALLADIADAAVAVTGFDAVELIESEYGPAPNARG